MDNYKPETPKDGETEESIINSSVNNTPVSSSSDTQLAPNLNSNPQKNKNKKLILIVVSLLLIIALTTAYFLKSDDTQSVDDANNQQETSSTESNNQTITNYSTENYSVDITHPNNWEVGELNNYLNTPYTLKYIKSDIGNYIRIVTADGIGGDCEPNTDTVTLTKRIDTRTDDYSFMQFDSTNSEEVVSFDYLQLRTLFRDEYSNIKEGESVTDTCTNISNYPIYGNIYLTIGNTTDINDGKVRYEDIKDDTEFITALESIEFKKL